MTTRLAGPSLVELPGSALVKAEDVAKFIGVSVRTIQRAGIPAVTVTPRVRRYFVKDVLAWLERQRGNGGAA